MLDRSDSIEKTPTLALPHLDVAGLTHVGMRRDHNEDNLLVLQEQGVFVVADGMGGHASGEVASRVAIEEVAGFFIRTARDADATWPFRMDPALGYDENRLLVGVRIANLRIHELANTEARYKKMGTTIVALSVGDFGVLIAHVGDSRAYRMRLGELKQLTEDHSLLNDYLKMQKLTPEEVAKFPHKNVISRALGMGPEVKVDLDRDQPQPGDIYLLCSDGLSGMLSDAEITRLLGLQMALDLKARALVDAANAAGGADNISVILVGVG